MVDPDLAWAAGLFEGEGCISKANKESVRLDLAMHERDIDILKKFRRVMNRGKLYGPYKNNMIFWLVFGREISCSVLLDLWPYLGERRKRRAIDFYPRMSELS